MKAIRTNTAAADTRKTAAETPDAAGIYVYIGPSVTGLIKHGTVYYGGRAAALRAAAPVIEKFPDAGNLIVSVRELPEARLEVKRPGTGLHYLARRIAAKL